MKQTFLLQEVIDDLVNTDKSLSSPLVKLNYFGRLIKNQELIDYTQSELTGYSVSSESLENIPEYRKGYGILYIDMQIYMNRHTEQLPASMVDENYREFFRNIYVFEGIAAIEKVTKDSEDNSNKQIVNKVPMELLHALQEPARKLYKSDARVDVVGARVVGNINIFVEIPNAIRTRLLDFVMSIAEAFGYDIEIDSFNKQKELNNQTIIHQMSTTINNSGDGNVINTGNDNKITNKANFYKGNLERLQDELRKQGVDDSDIQEISAVVVEEKPDEANNRLGSGSNSWISGIINKSLNGIGKISTGLTVNILATLIKQYYGLD